MSQALRPLLCFGLLVAAFTAFSADRVDADATHVTRIADRVVAEYQSRFPLYYETIGLPTERHDGLDDNTPAGIAQYRALLKSLEQEVSGIPEGELVGRPAWPTWHYLRQLFAQERANATCRSELWQVSAFGWQATYAQLVGSQPVGTPELRQQALQRWGKVPAWIDQEIANLREGLKTGHSAAQATVRTTLAQLDAMLAVDPGKSPFMSPAERDKAAGFGPAWAKLVQSDLWPAMKRYRDFLRDEYLPKTRQSVALSANVDGAACYRALIRTNTTVDEDPGKLYQLAVAHHDKERELAVKLGKGIFGEKATDWKTLADLMRADPRNKFASSDEIRIYTEKTVAKAEAAAGKMVLVPPKGQVKIEPFPEFSQATAPGGQYWPAADDGSRPATYFYRNVPEGLPRASLQAVILHETLPGHHLQLAVLAERGQVNVHPIARLLILGGPTEGWATYAEEFARELGLYDSDFEVVGNLMGSITPMMIADLGMQTQSWSADRAVQYLVEEIPLRPVERLRNSVATMTGLPSFVLAYPLGGMQFEAMRARAQQQLGDRFDVRAFHQVLLEDGMLPFAALEAKVDRWVKAGGK
jgi:uncharacterized protein (DUF885 family)